MTCAKLAGMLEQAPTTAVIPSPECVSAGGRTPAIGHAGPRARRRTPRARACITMLAAALLALAPGCSLLLDFDVPPVDAAPPDATPIYDAPPEPPPMDAAPASDGGEPDADVSRRGPLSLDE